MKEIFVGITLRLLLRLTFGGSLINTWAFSENSILYLIFSVCFIRVPLPNSFPTLLPTYFHRVLVYGFHQWTQANFPEESSLFNYALLVH